MNQNIKIKKLFLFICKNITNSGIIIAFKSFLGYWLIC